MKRFKRYFEPSLFLRLIDSVQSLIYPPLCLHCDSSLTKEFRIFCHNCTAELVLINAEERCPLCFSPDYVTGYSHCSGCYRKRSFLNRVACAFDYQGPASTLIKRLKYGQQTHLAQGAGAFLATQFLRLSWPLPDVVIPVPISLPRRLDRGFNQSLLIARTLSEILGCPILDVIKRRADSFSQVGLNLDQRMADEENPFYLKQNVSIEDKCVLIIDDVLTSGKTLQACAKAVISGFPKQIYGLTVCQTIP